MIKTVYQSSGSGSLLHFLEIFKSTKIGFGLNFSAKSNRHRSGLDSKFPVEK
ncbi:hypothetical protein V6Z11_D09G011300 [Gossypium hirsutum]